MSAEKVRHCRNKGLRESNAADTFVPPSSRGANLAGQQRAALRRAHRSNVLRVYCGAGTRVACQDTNCNPRSRLAQTVWKRSSTDRSWPLTVTSKLAWPDRMAMQP